MTPAVIAQTSGPVDNALSLTLASRIPKVSSKLRERGQSETGEILKQTIVIEEVLRATTVWTPSAN